MRLVLCLFIFPLSIALTSLSCRRDCEHPNGRIDVPINQEYKDTVCHFTTGEQWIFKSSNGGDIDTAIVRNFVSTYEIGNCRQVGRVPECCEDYWYEGIKLLLHFSPNSAMTRPDTITLSEHANSTVSYKFNYDSHKSALQMNINGKTLKDVYVWKNTIINENLLFKVYWSISKGLVSYQYYSLSTNTLITYERTDL